MKEYHYVDSHRVRKGPFLIGDLIRQEDFSEESLVWSSGMRGWCRASEVKELVEAIAAPYAYPASVVEESVPAVDEPIAEEPVEEIEEETPALQDDTDSEQAVIEEAQEETPCEPDEQKEEISEIATEEATESEVEDTASVEDMQDEEVPAAVEAPVETIEPDNETDNDSPLPIETPVEETVSTKVVVPPPYIPAASSAPATYTTSAATPQKSSSSGGKAIMFVLLGFIMALILTSVLMLVLFANGVFGKNSSATNYADSDTVLSDYSYNNYVSSDGLYKSMEDESDDDEVASYEGDGYYPGTLHVSGDIDGWGCYELYVHGSTGWVSSCSGSSRGPIRVDRYDSDDGYLVVSAISNGTVVGTYSGYASDEMYSGIFTNSSGKSGDFFMVN